MSLHLTTEVKTLFISHHFVTFQFIIRNLDNYPHPAEMMVVQNTFFLNYSELNIVRGNFYPILIYFIFFYRYLSIHVCCVHGDFAYCNFLQNGNNVQVSVPYSLPHDGNLLLQPMFTGNHGHDALCFVLFSLFGTEHTQTGYKIGFE